MTDTRRRVKLYALNAERQWDDKGTGHVSSTYVERLKGISLLVRAEADGEYKQNNPTKAPVSPPPKKKPFNSYNHRWVRGGEGEPPQNTPSRSLLLTPANFWDPYFVTLILYLVVIARSNREKKLHTPFGTSTFIRLWQLALFFLYSIKKYILKNTSHVVGWTYVICNC